MSNYSVLLVDDEEFVFDVMMKKLDWEALGFRIDGYARNGLEALEMAEENLPDVVMTDIKMPYMDGLTLCKKLKEKYPNIRVIIFSGFDEFEYAKEAIRAEAEEYILKPIDAQELSAVFTRVKNSLDKEIAQRRNVDMLQEYYMNSLPLLQENFYISLLEGRIPSNQISKYAYDYQIDLSGACFGTALLHVSYQEKGGAEVEIAPFMLSLSVQKLVEEQLAGQWNAKTLIYLGDILVIVQMEQETQINQFTDFMDRFCKMAKRICKATVTAGIGYVVSGPEHLRTSYKGAKNASSYRVMYGNMQAINIQEVELKQKESKLHQKNQSSKNIVKAIKTADKEALREAVAEFCQGIREERRSIREYRGQLMKLTVELMEFSEQYDIEMKMVSGSDLDMMDAMSNLDSPDSLEAYIMELAEKLMDEVSEKRQDNRVSFVIKAEEYVKDHYTDENLTIETICSYLNVSSSYFSTAFKKDTGKTFINYLTDYRMEQAVLLLDTTEYKTYEVAAMVGYSDPNYFSYAFKKKMGISPTRYKRHH